MDSTRIQFHLSSTLVGFFTASIVVGLNATRRVAPFLYSVSSNEEQYQYYPAGYGWPVIAKFTSDDGLAKFAGYDVPPGLAGVDYYAATWNAIVWVLLSISMMVVFEIGIRRWHGRRR